MLPRGGTPGGQVVSRKALWGTCSAPARIGAEAAEHQCLVPPHVPAVPPLGAADYGCNSDVLPDHPVAEGVPHGDGAVLLVRRFDCPGIAQRERHVLGRSRVDKSGRFSAVGGEDFGSV